MKKLKIYVDDKFDALVTNLVSCMIFSFVAPLIIGLTIMSIKFNKWLYKFMVIKLKWKLTIHNTRQIQTFPMHFVCLGIIFGQILTLLFFIYAIGNNSISICFGVAIFIMNITCIIIF